MFNPSLLYFITVSRKIQYSTALLSVMTAFFPMRTYAATGETMETSTGALLEEQQQKWTDREERIQNFWAEFMNNRKERAAFVQQNALRREKRKEKRIQCRSDVRRANRDTILTETLHCFRATLTLDLEILRKEKQYIERIAGVTDTYRTAAELGIQNTMDAMATIVEAIDVGVYTSAEQLTEAKTNLEIRYRQAKRLALTKVRIDHSKTWIEQLIMRIYTITLSENPSEEVQQKLEESIVCFEQKESLLDGLLPLEDNNALIEQFRQVQSEIKFCVEMARDAETLNKEIEQENENQQ